jgi:hypothetical protein
MVIPDFFTSTRKNGQAHTHMKDTDFGLGSVILHGQCVDISPNHTGLVLAVLPCLYVEIKDNHTTGEPKPVRLSLISIYGQGRMAEVLLRKEVRQKGTD